MPSSPPVKTLLEGLESHDANVRTQAWLSAGDYQADAVVPVARVFASMDAKVQELVQQNAGKEKIEYPLEAGRTAKRALWKIVLHGRRAGRGRQAGHGQTAGRAIGRRPAGGGSPRGAVDDLGNWRWRRGGQAGGTAAA